MEGVAANSYRGAASTDFDNDGKIDLLVLPIDGAPVLLKNGSHAANSWLGVRLKAARANWEGIGSRVEIEFCGKWWSSAIRNGGSYVSRNDPRLHFGIGRCGLAGRVTVHWPRGGRQQFEDVEVNQWVTFEEYAPSTD